MGRCCGWVIQCRCADADSVEGRLPTYIIKSGDTLSKVARRHGLTLTALLSANPRYRANPNVVAVGDELKIPARPSAVSTKKKTTKKGPKNKPSLPGAVLPSTGAEAADDFVVPFGQLTFDAEGMETPGRFFSRRLHVPGRWSGATIGRGYDMGFRSRTEVVSDLTASGVTSTKAGKFALARGRKGKQARDFIKEKGLDFLEITPREQKALFLLTYRELEGDVIRICNKVDVVEKYGALQWDALEPVIRDVLVDLRYRGDYTGATREKVQPAAVKNSMDAFARALSDEDYWIRQRGVPRDRFRRRRRYVRQA